MRQRLLEDETAPAPKWYTELFSFIENLIKFLEGVTRSLGFSWGDSSPLEPTMLHERARLKRHSIQYLSVEFLTPTGGVKCRTPRFTLSSGMGVSFAEDSFRNGSIDLDDFFAARRLIESELERVCSEAGIQG